MLAVLLVSSAGIAAGEGSLDPVLVPAQAVDRSHDLVGLQFVLAWPDWCVTPEGQVRFEVHHVSSATTSPPEPFCAEAASDSPGPSLESAGEATAAPRRTQGHFWTAAYLPVADFAAAHSFVLDLADPAPPAPVEPASDPQVMPDLSPPPPLFPVYEAVPDWTDEEATAVRAVPTEARGIEVQAQPPTELQAAAHRIREGIAAGRIETEQAVVAGLVLLAAGVALYQRITPARSTEHETRALIRKLLTDRPDGATAGEVGRLLDMNRKTAEYHLTYLARLGTLRTGLDEHGARLYSLKAIPARRTLVERMLLLVRERPGLSVPQAAEALGVSRSSADRYAKALVVSGALESRLVGGERKLYERAG